MSFLETLKNRFRQIFGMGNHPDELGDYGLDDDYQREDYSESLRRVGKKLTPNLRRSKDEYSYGDDDSYGSQPRVPGGLKTTGDWIAAILLFPLQLVFWPFKSILTLFHNTGIDIKELEDPELKLTFGQKVWKHTKILFRSLLVIPFRLAMAPVYVVRSLLAGDIKEAVFVLPALSVMALFAYVFFCVFFRMEVIENRYRRGIDAAFAQKDYAKCKTYYQRMMKTKELSAPQELQYAQVLAQTGELSKAVDLFNKLAPDDGMGFSAAHRLKAFQLVGQLNQSTDPEILKKLNWHLKNSYDNSPEMQQLWAKYYLAVGKPEEAVAALERAVDAQPELYNDIARLYAVMGRRTEQKKALAEVEELYSERLKRDTLDHRTRIALATVLTNLEKLDQAERLLLEGLRIQPDAAIKRALASFYVVRHDLGKRDGMELGDQLTYLIRSIRLDANLPTIYQRLVEFYMESGTSPEEAEKVYKALLEVVAGDQPSALAHFAMSNLLWKMDKKEKAQFHVERAYKMEPGFVVVINNLAWMIAHAKEPDLERAFELATIAVDTNSNEPRFRDTLGTVLMKQKKYDEAINEFEIALEQKINEADRREIHRKLGRIYTVLGQEDLARIHSQNATEIQE
ncbi:MAG: tetratricopeptide repeat protein [Planctomycetota bacterium]